MKVEADREELDEALALKVNRILIVVGGAGTRAEVYYTEAMKARWDKRHVHAQVIQVDRLSSEERELWFAGAEDDPADCFVLLQGAAPKSVLMSGRVQDLFLPNTDLLDFMRVRGLFSGMKFRGRRLG